MLASIRRSLVSRIEDLHVCRQDLRRDLNMSTKRKVSSETSIDDDRHIEEVLEGALLHLGRCNDLVRPAGLLVSSVSNSDCSKAFHDLQHSMSEIRLVYDPDRPLRPSEWGKLMDEERKISELSDIGEIDA